MTSAALTTPHPAPSSHTRLFANEPRCFSTYLARTMDESQTVDAKPPDAPPSSNLLCANDIFVPSHSCSYGRTKRSSSVLASRFHAHRRMKSEAPDPVNTRLGFFPGFREASTAFVPASGASRLVPTPPFDRASPSASSPDPPHPSGSIGSRSTRRGIEPPTSPFASSRPSSSENSPRSISFASTPAVAVVAAAAATASPPSRALAINPGSLSGAAGPNERHGLAATYAVTVSHSLSLARYVRSAPFGPSNSSAIRR